MNQPHRKRLCLWYRHGDLPALLAAHNVQDEVDPGSDREIRAPGQHDVGAQFLPFRSDQQGPRTKPGPLRRAGGVDVGDEQTVGLGERPTAVRIRRARWAG